MDELLPQLGQLVRLSIIEGGHRRLRARALRNVNGRLFLEVPILVGLPVLADYPTLAQVPNEQLKEIRVGRVFPDCGATKPSPYAASANSLTIKYLADDFKMEIRVGCDPVDKKTYDIVRGDLRRRGVRKDVPDLFPFAFRVHR